MLEKNDASESDKTIRTNDCILDEVNESRVVIGAIRERRWNVIGDMF